MIEVHSNRQYRMEFGEGEVHLGSFAEDENTQKEIEKVLPDLLIFSLFEQLHYYNENNPDGKIYKAEDLFDALTNLSAQSDDNNDDIIAKPPIFYRMPEDGRSFRVDINDLGEGTNSRELIKLIWKVTGKYTDLEEYPPLHLNFKGGGPNFTGISLALESWRANHHRPEGVTSLDANENRVAKKIESGEASRLLLMSFGIEAISSNDKLVAEDFVDNSQLVLEIFFSPGGYNISDLVKLGYKDNKLWGYIINQITPYYFDIHPRKINDETKKEIAELLADKYIRDFTNIAKYFRFIPPINRSRQNTTVVGPQDLDDLRPLSEEEFVEGGRFDSDTFFDLLIDQLGNIRFLSKELFELIASHLIEIDYDNNSIVLPIILKSIAVNSKGNPAVFNKIIDRVDELGLDLSYADILSILSSVDYFSDGDKEISKNIAKVRKNVAIKKVCFSLLPKKIYSILSQSHRNKK